MYRMSLETESLVGLHIRNLRTEARETLAQTAAAAGISESLLSRIENGHRRPARGLLERLAAHFSVPIDDFTMPEPASVPRRMRGATETSWPMGTAPLGEHSATGALVLADLAIATALGQLRETLRSEDHVERYRACRALAKLASQPLELLHHVSIDDPDPMVREATRQLLSTLVEAYVEAKSA